MDNRVLSNQAGQYVEAHGRKKRWLKVVTALAAIAVFCTTYALIMPAVTMQGKTHCGYEEHKEHSDECYEQIKKLTCTLSAEGHKHTAQCYSEERTLTCGIEETEGHQHTDSCYSEEQILVCENDSPDHVHDESCYATHKVLICGNAEYPAHHHDENCYTTQSVLTCGKEEQEPHRHTEECYTIIADTEHLTCKYPIHTHTLQCYSDPEADVEKAEIWEKTFEDVTLSGNWSRDVVSIAETQLGYTESKLNYEVQSNGTSMKGYTRYGAWYGIPYGDWCAMFCSFCLNYAGVDAKLMPRDANCPNWIRTLSQKQYDLYHPARNEKAEEEEEEAEDESAEEAGEEEKEEAEKEEEAEKKEAEKKEAEEAEDAEEKENEKEEKEPEEEKYIPRPGDLIFFDWDRFDPKHPEYRSADHIGFVAELIYDEKTEELTQIKTIEGNSANRVQHVTYSINDSRILGYGEIPRNPDWKERTIESKPASDGAVAVISGYLPEKATAVINAVSVSEKELVGYVGQAQADLMKDYVAYDIKIMLGDKEWEPDDSVNVVVKQTALEADPDEGFGVAHVDEETKEATNLTGEIAKDGEISFDTDGFSLYIFYTFTVDFHYEGLSFSIAGMDSILLSKLFEALSIDKSVADIVSVTFSDPSLLSIKQTEDGDWLLTSQKAFSSSETLSVVFADGSGLVIDVTDAQIGTDDVWEVVTDINDFVEGGVYAIVNSSGIGTKYAFDNRSGSSYRQSVTVGGNATNGYTLTVGSGTSTTGLPESSQWEIAKTGTNTVTVQNIGNGKYLRLGNSTWLSDTSENETATKSSSSWTLKSGSNYLNYGSSQFRRNSSSTSLTIYRLKNGPVWVYHAGASAPYKKYSTLHDATYGNSALANGDIIELHDDIIETAQSVIQKSITVKSVAGQNYTVDFGTDSREFTYVAIPCDEHPDPNIGALTELETRDCITVVPEHVADQITVFIQNVTFDGLDAYHNMNDPRYGNGPDPLQDNHLLQLIHGAEVTLSGVTIQNYTINQESNPDNGLNSNGAISQDGREVVKATDGRVNRLILKDGTVIDNCDSNRGNPYNTGGIAVNSGVLDVYDAEIRNCDSRGGAAIMIDSSSVCTLHDEAYIHDCHGQNEGAAIRNSGTLNMLDGALIEDCGPQTGSESTLIGGAVWNKKTFNMQGGTITGCTASNGGAVYNTASATTTISGGTITGCTASNGGAVYNAGDLYVSGGTVTDNTASADSKTYSDDTATFGAGVYQNGMMYLSGAPEYAGDQDVYLPEGRVITKNGDITIAQVMPVVLEDEVRFRDVLVSQSEDGTVVQDGSVDEQQVIFDLAKFNIKLSNSAFVTYNGKSYRLFALYNPDGNNVSVMNSNVLEMDIIDGLVVEKIWKGAEETPDSVSVSLYNTANNGRQLVETVSLSADESWKHKFENITVNPDGSIPYVIEEAPVEDYYSVVKDVKVVHGTGEDEPCYFLIQVENSSKYAELEINKKWEDTTPNRTHGEVTVNVIDQDGNAAGNVKLNADNGWKNTIRLPVPEDGQMNYTFEEVLSAADRGKYLASYGTISYVEEKTPVLWISGNFAIGSEYVIYGGGYALSHDGSTLTNVPIAPTTEMILANGELTNNYFTGDQITDNEVWTATGTNINLNYLTAKGTAYSIYCDGSNFGLNSEGSASWSINNGKLKQGYAADNKYLNPSDPTVVVNSANAENVKIYTKYEGDTIPAHYEVTITNKEIESASLEVEKVWENDVPSVRPESVTVNLYKDGNDKPTKLVLDSSCNWKGQFTGLAVNADGTLPYHVEEEPVKDYSSEIGDITTVSQNDGICEFGVQITNTSDIPFKELQIIKEWKDLTSGISHDDITVRVLDKDKTVVADNIVLGNDNSWQTSVRLPFVEGTEYTVEEVLSEEDAEKYSVSYSKMEYVSEDGDIPEHYEITVTNTEQIVGDLMIEKVWEDDKTEHGPVTVNVIDSEGNTVRTVVLNSENNWSDTVSLPLNENGKMDYTFEEILSEGEAGKYWIDYGTIHYVEGETPVYWVPVDPTAFAAKDFVIYGDGRALSHDGGTLKTASPALTNESKTIGGKTYESYFTEDQITDNEIWTASGASNTTLTAKGTSYKLYRSGSSSSNYKIGLTTNTTDTWSISSGKLRRGTSGSVYLNIDADSFYTSSSGSATTITLYEKVEDEPLPGHYEVTITNKEIEYRDLLIKKAWDDVTPDREHDPVTVTMWNKAKDTSWTVTLSEDNEWQATVQHLPVSADGRMEYTFEEEISDAEKDDYIAYYGEITPVYNPGAYYYVKESDITGKNEFVSGQQYMLYGSGRAVSHSGSSFTVANPSKGTGAITVGSNEYTDYFPATGTGAVPDAARWTYSGTSLSDGGSNYFKANKDNLSLGSSGSTVSMVNGKLKTVRRSGDDTYTRYLTINTNSVSSGSSGGTDITLYRYVQAQGSVASYEVTITNDEIEYTNLTVNKTWSDGNTDHDPVTVHLYDKRTNEEVNEAELSNDNGWTCTFERLIKPAENQPFGYYVIEDYVPGYISMPSEITELVANQTYWVPASTNQFSAGTDYLLYSNGYVIERNGASAVKTTAVTRGMTVGGTDYPTYIDGDEVSDIESTAVWSAERMGNYGYGGSIAIKNGNYYLKYGSGTSGYQLSTSPGTVTMYNNSKLNLYTGSGDDRSNHYMNISTGGTLSYTSKNANASAFTLYVKRTVATDVSGYEMTLENKEVITDPSSVIDPPDVHKTIDYLGDDGTNPDTDLAGEDDYRLYLDIDNLNLSEHPEGIDLLLILDGTSSMTTTAPTDGDYPVTHMDEIVNGSYGPGVERLQSGLTGNQDYANTYAREADGLVYQFLNMNPNNRVGVVEFSSWSDKNTVIRQDWTTKAGLLGTKADDPKNYYIDVTSAGSGTNYEAGYKRAEQLLAHRNSDHPVIMVFMTDGRPNSYIDDSNQNVEYKANNDQREYDNQQGWQLGKRLIADASNNIISTAVVAIGEAAAQDDEGVNAREMLIEHAHEIGGPLLIGDAADTMRDAMFKAVGLVGYAPLKITDDLSDYVTFADDLDLKITFEKIGSDIKTVWTDDGATDDNVDDGEPIVTGVVISGDRIEVTFNPLLKLLPLKRITVSYNVVTTQEAKDTYSADREYPDTGDEGTDYPGNTTSSEQPGFHSNDQAQVVYRDAFEQYSEDYDHPVVQVPYEPVVPVPPPEIEYPEYGDDEVEIGKQIDYLGNDGVAGMDALYRLYLSLEAEEQPIDLLLVLDQSGSMAKTLVGGTANDTDADPSNDSRQKIMLDFLNGTQQSDGSYNGFIAQFLAANDDNDLAILTFSQDSSLDATKRYIHPWGDKTNYIPQTLTPKGATNYMAALWAANEIWKLEADKEAQEAEALGSAYKAPKKIMIFLSDGEPTFAYSDGKLQRGLAQSTVVGNGYTFNQLSDSISPYLASFLGDCASDVKDGGVDFREMTLFLHRRLSAVDDDGEYCSTYKNSISSKADDRVKFPVVCQITGMIVDAPGISDWPLGEIDADMFTPWYNEVVASAINDSDLTAYLEWEEEGIKSVGDTYDLFWLSEWAYSEFAAANEDVITYTVGFSQETDGKYGEAPAEGEDTRRERAEVLKYMSGNNRFFQCNTADQLIEALNSIVLRSVTMTDTLSGYVDFALEPNLEITLTDANYSGFYEEGDDFAYLYKAGAFTELGAALLDTTATKIDRTTGKVDIVFKPGVGFNDDVKIEAAFTVQLTQEAFDAKETYGDTYNGIKGDIDLNGEPGAIGIGGEYLTDRDLAHITSSGEYGFYSNAEAEATWTLGGVHSGDFPKPVVQVPDPVDIRLKKVDAGGDFMSLEGAEFDLYCELSREKEGSITYTDENNVVHHLMKINTESLVSEKSDPIEVNSLRVGRYYLFETRAPDGYIRLERPVIFVVSSSAITLSADEANAQVKTETPLLLEVKNSSGYELPETGGSGTLPFTLCGIGLMATALMYGFSMRRKRERRYER